MVKVVREKHLASSKLPQKRRNLIATIPVSEHSGS